MADQPFSEFEVRFAEGYLSIFEILPPDSLGISTGKRLVLRQSDTPYESEVTVSNEAGFIQSTFDIPLTFSLIHRNEFVSEKLTIYHRRQWLAIAIAVRDRTEAVSRMNRIAATFCGVAIARGAGGTQHYLRRLYRISGGRVVPQQVSVIDFVVDVIDIEGFAKSLEQAFWDCQIEDSRLEKAAQYFSAGQLVFDSVFSTEKCQHNPAFGSHQILAAQLLYYKACTAIVGDPATEPRFQSAYRSRGISKDTFKKILEVKSHRDSEDVAHSTDKRIGRDRSVEMAKMAKQTAGEVIREYIAFLRSDINSVF